MRLHLSLLSLLSLAAAPPAAAQVVSYGSPCTGASGTAPTLSLSTAFPVEGQGYTLSVAGPPLTTGILGVGLTSLVPGVSLGDLLPGCSLGLLPIFELPFDTDATGAASFPYQATAPGVALY
ncbi:MAG: hypothetical protein AAFZ65_04960, partial [Planctomycetota bacterium]